MIIGIRSTAKIQKKPCHKNNPANTKLMMITIEIKTKNDLINLLLIIKLNVKPWNGNTQEMRIYF